MRQFLKYCFCGLLVGVLLIASNSLLVKKNFSASAEKVFICTGPQSRVYHKTKSCKGLRSCSKDIIQVTKKEAIERYGRRACKVCYGG